MNVVGIIPARYKSSRFPGKPLALINEVPMIIRVWRQCKRSKYLTRIIIATDDDRIYNLCCQYSIEVVMTHDSHATGTDRVAEVANQVSADLIVNIQGDEPLIDPNAIDELVAAMMSDNSVKVANGYAELSCAESVANPNIVKVIMDVESNVLAYSRSPIPHDRSKSFKYNRQLGLYSFRPDALREFSCRAQGPIELTEFVEMYRFIEYGTPVRMVKVEDVHSISVDVPADVSRVEEVLNDERSDNESL